MPAVIESDFLRLAQKFEKRLCIRIQRKRCIIAPVDDEFLCFYLRCELYRRRLIDPRKKIFFQPGTLENQCFVARLDRLCVEGVFVVFVMCQPDFKAGVR